MHTKEMKILAFILYSKGSQSLIRPWYECTKVALHNVGGLGSICPEKIEVCNKPILFTYWYVITCVTSYQCVPL